MPELPELEVLRRTLAAELPGRTLAEVVVNRPECVNAPPEAYAQVLRGATFTTVWRKGKTVICDLDNGGSLLIHLALGGDVVTRGSADHDPEVAQIVLALTDGSALHFERLMLGNAHVVPTHRIGDTRIGKLGPDALDELPDADGLRTIYGSRGRAMKALLCDQSLVSGLGNSWSDEVLVRARIHPQTPGKALARPDFERLHSAIREAIEVGIRAAEGTLPMEQQPRFKVHGHEGEPCRLCQTTVRRLGGSGGAYFCPKCQRRKAARRKTRP